MKSNNILAIHPTTKVVGFLAIYFVTNGDIVELLSPDPNIFPVNKNCAAPTHALAIEWLRANFKIYIWCQLVGNGFKQSYLPCWITNLNPNNSDSDTRTYESPAEATNAAILYALKNLMSRD